MYSKVFFPLQPTPTEPPSSTFATRYNYRPIQPPLLASKSHQSTIHLCCSNSFSFFTHSPAGIQSLHCWYSILWLPASGSKKALARWSMAFHQCFQNHFRGFRGFRGQTAKPKSNSNSKFHCQNYSLAEVNERVIWWRKQISDDTKISSLGASLLNTFPKHLYTSIYIHIQKLIIFFSSQ